MRVAILGAGAMGSALALHLRRRGHGVRLWATPHDGPVLRALRAGGVHPALRVPVEAETFGPRELAAALRGSDGALLALSSEGLAAAWRRIRPRLRSIPVANVAKGLYTAGDRVVTFSALAGPREVALGGPTIAREVALGRPTRGVAAGAAGPAGFWARALDSPEFRVAPLADRVGVEVCGALKNVYAISIGAAEGLRRRRGWESGDNLRAALFARSLEEMGRLCRAAGGRRETASTVAGAGDLEVTARAGRNAAFGALLGEGLSPARALRRVGSTVEGAQTAPRALRMARRFGLDLGLLEAVAGLLRGTARPEALLSLA